MAELQHTDNIQTLWFPSGIRSPFGGKPARAAVFVNKSLSLNSWHAEYVSRDYVMVSLKIGEEWMHIHNVYSQPPGSPTVVDYDNPLELVREQLDREGEHILLGDFNLHHPRWCGVRNPTAHAASGKLIVIVDENRLELLTPNGVITRDLAGRASTIDLAFASRDTAEKVVECKVRKDLGTGSDHYPVCTTFSFEQAETAEQVPKRK